MSEMTNKSIELLLNQLNEWIGSEITIEKLERNDTDYNKMTLKDVEIVNQLEDEDDYVDPHTIQLQGPGLIMQKNGNATVLPLESYELPIREMVALETSNELLTLKTDRATYTLKK